MEYIALAAVGFLFVSYFSYDGKVKKLAKQIKKLKKQINGGNVMSKMVEELVGATVHVVFEDGIGQDFTIEACDEDWVKISQTGKAGKTTTRLVRLDVIAEFRKVD